jgi:type I restriction enzyme S subunit
MGERRKFRWGDFSQFRYGKMPDKNKLSDDSSLYPIFSGYRIVGYYNEYNAEENELIIVARGVGGTGDVKLTPAKCYLTNLSIAASIDESVALREYLYYYFALSNLRYLNSGSAQSQITISDLQNVLIPLPSLEDQQVIVDTLSCLDDKIELNNRINANLEAQAQAIFRSWFVDFEPWGGVMPDDWTLGEAKDFFDISIGKTPPRKEPQWFTTNPQDVIWVSISDTGSCGVFISDSSEYLTTEAVSRFNVKVVPGGTVLLSFKLAIGRVAITDGDMTTNEAIAHFKCSDIKVTEYLYFYLSVFNYQSLGNTSSIATAVNSKTIKAMTFVMPDAETLQMYHEATTSYFEQIRVNLMESRTLAAVRDALLPRLMSGEIEIKEA